MIAELKPLLSSVRILELGHYIAAPFATRVLADLGADVIKVEPPGVGDPVRQWGAQIDGHSPWWSIHGRNKRAVTANLKSKAARELILRLAAQCDAVVENYRPGQLERFGLGPKDFEAVRPGMVMVRISGYGQTGPESSRSGFGVIGEAKGGLRHLCGYPGSELPPVRTGIAIGDSIAGLYGAIGTLAAVVDQRSRGSKDIRVVDVALGESVLTLLEGCLPEYGLTGKVRQPSGSWIASASPSNAYRTKDEAWLLIAGNSDPLFRALAEIMGQPELASDPRFVDNQARCRNNADLDRLIGAWTSTHTAEAALEKLDAANIPASKIYTIADIAADQQYLARGMIAKVRDPNLGEILHPGVVPVVEGLDRSQQIRWTGPNIGQHNQEVYGGMLSLEPSAIAELKEKGAI